MGAFLPFSGGISQAPQLPAAAGSTRDPSTAQGGGVVAPSLGSHFPVRAPKSTSPEGGGSASRVRVGCTPSRSRAAGEEGRCWASPAQPLSLCSPPRVLQADRREGGEVAWDVRQGRQPPAARLGCVLPWRAVPSTARPVPITAASPARRAPGPSGCRMPVVALPSRDPGQVRAEVEQGGWELGRGLAALMLSCGGRDHGPTSSSYLYHPVSFAATFTWDFSSPSLPVPARAKGGSL